MHVYVPLHCCPDPKQRYCTVLHRVHVYVGALVASHLRRDGPGGRGQRQQVPVLLATWRVATSSLSHTGVLRARKEESKEAEGHGFF